MARLAEVRTERGALLLTLVKFEREMSEGEIDWHVTDGVPVLSRSKPLELPTVDAFIETGGGPSADGVAALRRERPLEVPKVDDFIDTGGGTANRAVDLLSFE